MYARVRCDFKLPSREDVIRVLESVGLREIKASHRPE